MDTIIINQFINDNGITDEYIINWLTSNSNDIKNIYGNNERCFVVKNYGDIYCHGKNENGELGLGHFNNTTEFTKLPDMFNNPKYIVCSRITTFLVDSEGSVYACGDNRYGQLGIFSSRKNTNIFMKVPDYFKNPKNIFCGPTTAFLIKQDNSLFATGDNKNGELGLGEISKKIVFTKVKNIDFEIKKIYCNNNITIIVDINNNIYLSGVEPNDPNIENFFTQKRTDTTIFSKMNILMPD